MKSGEPKSTLERLNNLLQDEARAELTRCCGSSRWVREMVERRPFGSYDELNRVAEEIWWRLNETDWREAFAQHPKIGDIESLRKKFASTASWASSEQSGAANAPEDILQALAEANTQYENTFGYIFIVCATGKNADEMLAILNSRLPNAPEKEITIAATEQAKITALRIKKMMNA